MVRQTPFRALCGLVLSLGYGVPRVARAQTAPSDTVYHMQGLVVDGKTGQPIARALVTSVDRRLAAMTNGAGRFAIDVRTPSPGLSGMQGSTGAGSQVALVARKPGYVAPDGTVSVALDGTLSSAEVNLRLMPSASLEGTVFSDGSEPPEGVRVLLLQRVVRDGTPSWQVAGQRTTDRRGQFRFGDLSPGLYTALSTLYRGDEGGESHRGEISEGYPPTYLGDAPDLMAASRLPLQYGEAAHAELHIRRTPFYPVSVSVGVAPGVPVVARVSGAGRFSNFELSFNPRHGMVEGSLPDGNYVVVVNSFGSSEGFARVPLAIAGAPVHAGPVGMGSMGTVQVRVDSEFTGQSTPGLAASVHILLRPESDEGFRIPMGNSTGQAQEFTIRDVSPGEYRVEVLTSYGYVAAASSGTTDLLRNPLTVDASGSVPPIQVALRDDGGTLTGKVASPDGPLPQRTHVMLVPEDGGGRFTQVSAGSDGAFSFQEVPPGNYRLIASERSSPLPYRDPEAMRAYANLGSVVTIEAGQSTSADAELVKLTAGGVE